MLSENQKYLAAVESRRSSALRDDSRSSSSRSSNSSNSEMQAKRRGEEVLRRPGSSHSVSDRVLNAGKGVRATAAASGREAADASPLVGPSLQSYDSIAAIHSMVSHGALSDHKAATIEYQRLKSYLKDLQPGNAVWVRKGSRMWMAYLAVAICNLLFGFTSMALACVCVYRVGKASSCDANSCLHGHQAGGFLTAPRYFDYGKREYWTYWWLCAELLLLAFLLCVDCIVCAAVHLRVCLLRTKAAVLQGLRLCRLCSFCAISLSLSFLSPLLKVANYYCTFMDADMKLSVNATQSAHRICTDGKMIVGICLAVAVLAALSVSAMFTRRQERYFKVYVAFALLLYGSGIVLLVLAVLGTVNKYALPIQVTAALPGEGVFTWDVQQQVSIFFSCFLGVSYTQGLINTISACWSVYVSIHKSQLLNLVNGLLTFVLIVITLVVAGSGNVASAILDFFCNYLDYPVDNSQEAQFYARYICLNKPPFVVLWSLLFFSLFWYIVVFVLYVSGFFCWKPRAWRTRSSARH